MHYLLRPQEPPPVVVWGRGTTTLARRVGDRHTRSEGRMQRLSSHGRLTAAPITDERPGNVQSSSDNYWLHELSYSSLASNDSGYTQQPWLPDELCTHCMICQQRFDLWRWTHHCRDCGGYAHLSRLKAAFPTLSARPAPPTPRCIHRLPFLTPSSLCMMCAL